MGISIHALLAESDVCLYRFSLITLLISIHALLAESDVKLLLQSMKVLLFLSTLSLRRATKRLRQKLAEAIISIHALLAESDALSQSSAKSTPISIHALLAESDKPMPLIRFCPGTFLSTLSLRRATVHCVGLSALAPISIHALLAESDY